MKPWALLAALLASGCKTPGPPPLEIVAVDEVNLELAIWNELQARDPNAHIEGAKRVWNDLLIPSEQGEMILDPMLGHLKRLEPGSALPKTWPMELEPEWRAAYAECLKSLGGAIPYGDREGVLRAEKCGMHAAEELWEAYVRWRHARITVLSLGGDHVRCWAADGRRLNKDAANSGGARAAVAQCLDALEAKP